MQPQPSINAQPSYFPGESSETIPSNSISNQTSAQDSHSSLPNLGSNIRQSDVSLPQDHSILAAANTSQGPPTQISSNVYPQSSTLTGGFLGDSLSADLPPVMPVFGVSLDDLLRRDGSAIPLVVYQCLQAVDLFGLEVEGIYRLSGSSVHVTKLRNIFDNGMCT